MGLTILIPIHMGYRFLETMNIMKMTEWLNDVINLKSIIKINISIHTIAILYIYINILSSNSLFYLLSLIFFNPVETSSLPSDHIVIFGLVCLYE